MTTADLGLGVLLFVGGVVVWAGAWLVALVLPPLDGSPGAEGTWTAQEEALLAHLPDWAPQRCPPDGDPPAEALASLFCIPPTGAHAVVYSQFADAEDLREHFAVGAATGAPCPADVIAVAGQIRCSRSDGEFVVEWTHEPTLIASLAARDDHHADLLHRWWSQAGPSL